MDQTHSRFKLRRREVIDGREVEVEMELEGDRVLVERAYLDSTRVLTGQATHSLLPVEAPVRNVAAPNAPKAPAKAEAAAPPAASADVDTSPQEGGVGAAPPSSVELAAEDTSPKPRARPRVRGGGPDRPLPAFEREVVGRIMADTLPTEPPYRHAVEKAGGQLEQALIIMHLAKTHYESDLTANALAHVFTKRFGIPVGRQTLAKTLHRARTLVDQRTVKVTGRGNPPKLSTLTTYGLERAQQLLRLGDHVAPTIPDRVEDIIGGAHKTG